MLSLIYVPVPIYKEQRGIIQRTSKAVRDIIGSRMGFPTPNHLMKIWANYNISLTWIVRPFWDDSPNPNYDFQGSGEQGLVVMKFTQIYHILSIDSPLLTIINHRLTIDLPRPMGQWSSSIHRTIPVRTCPDLAWRTFTGLRMRSERVTRVWLHKAFSKSLCGGSAGPMT